MGVPYAELIGDPVAHSKSPAIHRFWLRKLGLQGDYRATRVQAAELADYFAARREDPDWRGCNVTMPHKRSILALLDEAHDFGVGAVNCISLEQGRLVGRNTDFDGFGEATPKYVDTDRPVCLLGTGGAARVVIAALDIWAVYQCNVVARDQAEARALLEPYAEYGRVFDFSQAEAALADAVGVINATPLGMAGCPAMPAAVLRGIAGMRRRAFAVDMVYTPLRTDFLAAAESRGMEAIDGLTMLIGQAAAAFVHFFGAAPPRKLDRALREVLIL